MPSYAARDFPLSQGIIAADTDLSDYPAVTLRYLEELGLVSAEEGGAFKAAVAFGSYAVDDPVDSADFSHQVFARLLARGLVVGTVAGPPLGGDPDNWPGYNLGDANPATATGQSTAASTREEGDPDWIAGWSTGGLSQKSNWYRWVAPATGTATVALGSVSFDTLHAVYTGSDKPSLVQVAQSDPPSLNFSATQGVVYSIIVSGYNSQGGTYDITVSVA